MEKKVKAFDNNKKDRIKIHCDQFDKTYEDLGNNEILIKGDNLEGLLDKIGMNKLGEIIN